MKLKRAFELNFWPSIADMVLAASMLFLLLWFVERFRTVELARANDSLRQEVASLRRDKPPIITLNEASGYTFDSGSPSLSGSFEQAIEKEIIPKLNNILKDYNVDVIEVIGHTDGQTVSTKRSNLDSDLEAVALEKKSVESMIFGSNVDLGLLRAIAVAQYIKKKANGRLDNVRYRFYSAAQLIPPTATLQFVSREPDSTRRRIELRFTRLSTKS
ncbi:MAG TPA: hypothetical protein VJH03_02135 [Blastocatellia bacterium]|nr:hypothetical protein [Blastocatellia bacterium]